MEHITEDYCSFEIAKLLNEKGFDVDTEHEMWYVIKPFSSGGPWNSYTYKIGDITREYIESYCIAMPTLQMVMKWLREVHNLHIDVDPSEGDWNPTVLELEDWSCVVKPGDEIPIQDSYEEACEAAIKYALEHLI